MTGRVQGERDIWEEVQVCHFPSTRKTDLSLFGNVLD